VITLVLGIILAVLPLVAVSKHIWHFAANRSGEARTRAWLDWRLDAVHRTLLQFGATCLAIESAIVVLAVQAGTASTSGSVEVPVYRSLAAYVCNTLGGTSSGVLDPCNWSTATNTIVQVVSESGHQKGFAAYVGIFFFSLMLVFVCSFDLSSTYLHRITRHIDDWTQRIGAKRESDEAGFSALVPRTTGKHRYTQPNDSIQAV
jgi:hypothetical protein